MSDDLFEKYLGNRLEGDDAARLKQVLAGDRQARAQFVQYLQEWQLFAEAARQVTAGLTGEPSVAPPEEEIAARPGGPTEVSRRRRAALRIAPPPRRQRAGRRVMAAMIPLAALAACLVVAVQISAPAPAPSPEAVATIAAAKPGVLVVRGDQRLPAAAGATLLPGDALSVPAGAQAVVRYADETRLEIAPGTSLVLVQAVAAAGAPNGAAGKRVAVNWGTVTAEVAKQPPGHPMQFTTPNAQATVLGTRLSLEVGSASTRLEVEHGLVGISRRADRAMVEVAAGQFATVAEGTELAARPMPGEAQPATEGDRRQGLKAEYFADTGFGKLMFTRLDQAVSFDLGLETTPLDVRPSHFSVRWSGQVQPQFSENYLFDVHADSGVRLLIDGKPIIDDPCQTAVMTHQGRIALEAGKRYALRLEYIQPRAGMMIKLSWASQSQGPQIIPAERLSPEP